MKKRDYIIRPVIFGLILFLVLYGLSFIFIPKDNVKERGMEQVTSNAVLAEKENTLDILVLGDSESYNSITPMEIYDKYGYTMYVAGTPAQKMFDTYQKLQAVIKKQKLKYFILETNLFYRKYSFFNIFIAKGKAYLPVLKYHDRWKNLQLHDFTGKVKYSYINYDKGYKYSKKRVKPKNPYYMIETDSSKEISNSNLLLFDKIVDLCNENNIKILLLSTPSAKNWSYEKHNGIVNLSKKYDIDYVDMNLISELNINWDTDTHDAGDHMNYSGAKKITAYLARYLYNKGDLMDHRGEKNYDLWEKSLEEYKKHSFYTKKLD